MHRPTAEELARTSRSRLMEKKSRQIIACLRIFRRGRGGLRLRARRSASQLAPILALACSRRGTDRRLSIARAAADSGPVAVEQAGVRIDRRLGGPAAWSIRAQPADESDYELAAKNSISTRRSSRGNPVRQAVSLVLKRLAHERLDRRRSARRAGAHARHSADDSTGAG